MNIWKQVEELDKKIDEKYKSILELSVGLRNDVCKLENTVSKYMKQEKEPILYAYAIQNMEGLSLCEINAESYDTRILSGGNPYHLFWIKSTLIASIPASKTTAVRLPIEDNK